MNTTIIKTTSIIIAIYLVSYFLTGVIGALANPIVLFYALNLVKKQNILAIKTVLIFLLVLNLGVIIYLFV